MQTLTDDELAALAHQATQALPDAPAPLLRAVLALWPAATAAAAPRALLRRIAAALQFDSWALPPQALGMRGLADDSRHLLFSAEGRDVDLRITRQPGGSWLLAGQVLGPDDSAHVLLVPADGQSGGHSARIDDLGEFHLEGVRAGQWCLSVETADAVVALPAIDVGGQHPA